MMMYDTVCLKGALKAFLLPVFLRVSCCFLFFAHYIMFNSSSTLKTVIKSCLWKITLQQNILGVN